MSEEVTYADLEFQDSSKRKNIHELDTVGIKGLPATFALHSTTCSVPWMAPENLGSGSTMPSAADWTGSLRKLILHNFEDRNGKLE